MREKSTETVSTTRHVHLSAPDLGLEEDACVDVNAPALRAKRHLAQTYKCTADGRRDLVDLALRGDTGAHA